MSPSAPYFPVFPWTDETQRTAAQATHSPCFATTHWSVVLAATGDSAQSAAALEQLWRTYWYPLYCYVRRCGHSPHDAQDLTQAFFAELLRKQYFRAADRQRGKFRSFLLTALRHFMAHEWEKARAAKRGGGVAPLCLDEQTAERSYQAMLTALGQIWQRCCHSWPRRAAPRPDRIATAIKVIDEQTLLERSVPCDHNATQARPIPRSGGHGAPRRGPD